MADWFLQSESLILPIAPLTLSFVFSVEIVGVCSVATMSPLDSVDAIPFAAGVAAGITAAASSSSDAEVGSSTSGSIVVTAAAAAAADGVSVAVRASTAFST